MLARSSNERPSYITILPIISLTRFGFHKPYDNFSLGPAEPGFAMPL